jgi:hypothetical protein
MVNLVHQRKVGVEPPLESINDTRNGILLQVVFRGLFKASRAAFLRVYHSISFFYVVLIDQFINK